MEKQANYKPFLTNSRSFRCGYTEDRTADRGGTAENVSAKRQQNCHSPQRGGHELTPAGGDSSLRMEKKSLNLSEKSVKMGLKA